ncbi:aminodeoxychorismate synthase component I [Dethiothermospora halolimnae]|uniref:aminodeoxychorismate synthase component I n=1 Tax=Dethiothermospora halolimnae TaxID=3114390 RepID=UPI003CCB7E4A
MLIKEIKTSLNSFEIYSIFKNDKYSFFLDSGMDHDNLGKYSFIGANPFGVFKSKNESITIIEDNEEKTFNGDPFAQLKKLLSKYNMNYKTDIPFIGGAVGYLSYDLCHHVEKLPRTAIDDVEIPDCFFGLYDGIIIIDHRENKVFISSLGIKNNEEKTIDNITSRIKEAEKIGINIELKDKELPVEFKSNFTKENYIKAVDKVRNYIKSGDIYQANLTQRFNCDLQESPFELYGKLRDINPAPFASFIDFGEGYIVSSSPERFVKVEDRIIETRPIKGTRPRGANEEEDIRNREELLSSEKDKAELLMIVDLERNDLGRISKTGTVEVTELFKLEEYSTVYHLVSTVIGEMKEGSDLVDVIKSTFPGGSITGAPKIRAMEIIDQLEPTQRNIYTGSIGYLGFNGDMDLNIVIRTIVCKDDRAYFQVGGGIVWDSDAEMEYEETLHKAKALIEALKK